MASDAITQLKLRVEGMDCGACALKIENGVKRLPGVSDVEVNYGVETLSLHLDEDRTSRKAIEERIRTLGYVPVAHPDGTGAARQAPQPRPAAVAWWTTPKARLAFAAGAALAAAFLVSQFVPAYGEWAYSVAALVGLIPIARRALAAATTGTPFTIETLMSVAAIGAIAIGEGAEAAVVVFLFAIGELLEKVAAGRARAGIEALINLVPRVARVERDGRIEEIPAEELAVGDIVVVRPGDRLPSDGEVVEGMSELDEAPITGESVPIAKEVGSKVFAGSINGSGVLRVQISTEASDNTIARIIHLVEEAQGAKAPTARFIDRFSAWYTPAAMAVAALIMVGPPLLLGASWETWIYRGLATLLIACPCALVISTPAAIASGLAAGARRGLLIKGGAALETLGRVSSIAFDKTGTLTEGRPKVTDVIAFGDDEDAVLARAAAVERDSSHPLATAIVAAAEERGLDLPKAYGSAMALPGKGVKARLSGGFVWVGSPRHAAEEATVDDHVTARLEALEADGKTAVFVIADKRVSAIIAMRDEPRDDAAHALSRLRGIGLRTIMLTGDNPRAAAAMSERLGIEAKAGLLPDQKLGEIGSLKAAGGVAMVGDGINDAPALAASSVGIAMGGGTDVALETAEAALLRNRVSGVADMVALSRATLGNIWQNIAIALGLKGIFLVTTLAGVTTLWMAILADTGATVLVTMNALRLLGFRGSSIVELRESGAVHPAQRGNAAPAAVASPREV